VADALRDVLGALGQPLVGVTCLARGADQVFARVVLEMGGTVEVVLPAADYRERKVKPENRADFESLIERASTVTVMPFEVSNRDAYFAASDAVLDTVERMVGVWDGEPSDGHGGTGDVVAAARERGIPIDIVWPHGAARR
jgi:hypothetical protein